jgi:hypothetical protein
MKCPSAKSGFNVVIKHGYSIGIINEKTEE